MSERILTDEQEAQVCQLWEQLVAAYDERMHADRELPTVESLFEHCPDGPFSWEGEPEDVGNPWCCGDRDCPVRWHQSCQYIDMGRDEQGRTWFSVYESNFSDGDYQPESGWDERDGDEPSPEILSDLWFYLEGRSIEHFYGWGLYDLYVAETGEDPLDNWFTEPTFERCIKAAQDNLNYLTK